MEFRKYTLADEAATMALGAALARAMVHAPGKAPSPGSAPRRLVAHLHGELGAGKTTLVRALLRGMHYSGPVRSPTYTLMEPYALADRVCLHLDLYRLADPGELEYIGLRELMTGPVLVLAEWPERGVGVLPEPDLVIALAYAGEGRQVWLEAVTPSGDLLLKDLNYKPENF